MKKTNIQFITSLITNVFIGWLTVSSLQSILPVKITHANVPEIPPQLTADAILLVSLTILIAFFNWTIGITFNNQLTSHDTHHLILKLINSGWFIITLLAFIAVSLVVNDGKLSDLANHLTFISVIGNFILLMINYGMTIKYRQLTWYRWSLCFQGLLIITFWLNLWISPV